MLRKLVIPLAACIFVCRMAAGAASNPANLVKNGGFDQGPQPSYFSTYAKGSTAIPGWTVTFGTVDLIGPHWHDADGGKNSIDLDGTPGPGGIAQSIATVPGATYGVSFELASNPECGAPVKRLSVAAGSVTRTYSFDATRARGSKMGWQTKLFSFKAGKSHTTLAFSSLDSKGSFCGPAIDAVRVWKTTVAVSVPFNLAGTWSATYPGGPLPVRITQIGAQMTASLLRGNAYVPAGKVELKGNVTGRMFPGQQLCALLGHVNPNWYPTTITIIDSNHFTSVVHGSGCSNEVDHFTRTR